MSVNYATKICSINTNLLETVDNYGKVMIEEDISMQQSPCIIKSNNNNNKNDNDNNNNNTNIISSNKSETTNHTLEDVEHEYKINNLTPISLDTDKINVTFNEARSSPDSPTKSLIEEQIRDMHRVVLTGGPCAGKTTSINRIRSFFESIGWKVYCVPETATLLLSSGIAFYELGSHTLKFQEDLLKTMLQIEDTINETARYYNKEHQKKVLVIYDRGAMDPTAYLPPDDWIKIKERNPHWNEVELRDNRYDQVIHLITAANGAEAFYSLDNNMTRTEGIELARELDDKVAKAWIGHPYMDVIDNCTEFEKKVSRVLQRVCERIGINFKGFDTSSRKRKFLLKRLPDDSLFPDFQDFNVVHNYLLSNNPNTQARIRKRGQSNNWVYTYTIRMHDDGQSIETRKQIDRREYSMLFKTADERHYTIYKTRRCFVWRRRYFQLDMYEEPCNPRCRGLCLLETHCGEDDNLVLPNFLEIESEVTNDSNYSMFNLSLKRNSNSQM